MSDHAVSLKQSIVDTLEKSDRELLVMQRVWRKVARCHFERREKSRYLKHKLDFSRQ
jgi:hypothetical protein